METIRTRFAPSPTGYMHLGNLRTALYTYLFARHGKGTFVLRIEDTDQEREVPGATEKIYDVLNTIGLTYDEGPDKGGEYGPYIQSQRKATYLPYAQELVEKGLAYYCFCTNEQLEEARAQCEAKGGTFKYDKRCASLPKEEVERRIASGEPWVIRLNVPTTGKAGFDDLLYGHVEADCDTLDDIVLIKADGLPTYNFANVIDDHLMGITHVLRGNEYLSSTPKYNLLYQGLGWEPPKYLHLPTVTIEDNGTVRKLSKRKGDPTYEDLLNMGFLQDAVINYIALLGWSPGTDQEFFSLQELIDTFEAKGISKSPSVFDMRKLTWFNSEYIRRLSPEDFETMARPWLEKALDGERFDLSYVCRLLQARTEVLKDLPGMVDFLPELPEYGPDLYFHKKMKTDASVAAKTLPLAIAKLESLSAWTEEALHEALLGAAAENGLKNGQLLWPVRVALSGKPSTPGGAIEIAFLLGRDESLRRLQKGLDTVKDL